MSISNFERWINEPCPKDVWVYRGQSAKYDSITPSGLRPFNRQTFGTRLFDIDPRIAYTLFHKSILREISEPTGILTKEINFSLEGTQNYLQNDLEEKISWSRIIRSLGQHYGFPSFYIDLTLNPWVAVAFATMQYNTNKILSTKPGVIYRWPARRDNNYKLYVNDIEVIDLSNVSLFFRRPVIQASVMALPVRLPKMAKDFFRVPGAALHFPVESDSLEVIDMKQLSDCESFNLKLSSQEPFFIKDLRWLFPDPIDLGFSYMTTIALLSLIVHYPEEQEFYEDYPKNIAQKLYRQYESMIKAAQVVLDRECFRLVPGLNVSPEMKIPLSNSLHTVNFQVELATDAVTNVGDVQTQGLSAKIRRKIARELLSNEDFKRESLLFIDDTIPFDVNIEYNTSHFFLTPVQEEKQHNKNIISEIHRRHNLFKDIVDRAEKVPAYAVLNSEKYCSFYEVFITNKEYENEIKKVVASQSRLNQNVELFLRRETNKTDTNEET